MDERQLTAVEAIIDSMTPLERSQPHLIDGSRRRRIARGSGTSIQDVNRLLRQFEDAKRLIKQVSGMERKGRRGRLPFPLQWETREDVRHGEDWVDAPGGKAQAVLPARGRRFTVAAQRPVHRGHRLLQSYDASLDDQSR